MRQSRFSLASTLVFIIGGICLTVGLAIKGDALIYYDLSKCRQAEKALLMGHARQAMILRNMLQRAVLRQIFEGPWSCVCQ